jgi:Uma2 family endonuclease
MAVPSSIATAPRGNHVEGEVVLRAVGWSGYDAILHLRGERTQPRLLYLDGNVFLMSPALRHENLADRVLLLVVELALGFGIPCRTCRSSTFRRETLQGGVEADASFYLANAHLVSDRETLDLNHDPPPDLVVEVVNTRPARHAVEVWRRFGVPEVWVAREDRLSILTLQRDGAYQESSRSLAFPGLLAVDLHDQLGRDLMGLVTEWLPGLRRWVAERVDLQRANPEGGA